MSHFNCEHCGTAIIDTPDGYITGCEHYPNTMDYDKEQNCGVNRATASGRILRELDILEEVSTKPHD